MRALLLILTLAACSPAPPSLASDALCAERAGAWDCAPNAVCVKTRSGWLDCLCCTLGPDAGWAVAFENTAADCAAQRKYWSSICPSP